MCCDGIDGEGLEGHTYTQVRQLCFLLAGAALFVQELGDLRGEEEALGSPESLGRSVDISIRSASAGVKAEKEKAEEERRKSSDWTAIRVANSGRVEAEAR